MTLQLRSNDRIKKHRPEMPWFGSGKRQGDVQPEKTSIIIPHSAVPNLQRGQERKEKRYSIETRHVFWMDLHSAEFVQPEETRAPYYARCFNLMVPARHILQVAC